MSKSLDKFLREQLENGSTLLVEDPADLHGYTGIPNAVLCNPAFSATDVRIYGIIRSHLRPGQAVVWPGQDRIAAMAGVVRETVNRSLARLRKAGLIDWFRRGQAKTNVYILKRIPQDVAGQYADFLSAQERAEEHRTKETKTRKTKDGVSGAGNPCVSSDVTPGSHQKNGANPCGCSDVTLGSHLDVTLGSHKENKDHVVVDNNTHAHESEEAGPESVNLPGVEKPGPESARKTESGQPVNESLEPPCPAYVREVTTALMKAVPGLGEMEGAQVAESLLAEFSVNQVLEKVELLAGAGRVRNIGGWLRQALREDWKRIPKNPNNNSNNNKQSRPAPAESGKEKHERANEKKRKLLRSLYL
ncbi:MAG: winged helix-turn-helix domain-containing protein [Peptococcaceae bacterium]|nr:winged helix-turn-helix domain-containing protein [Peptococcaceae bacterium]